MNYINDIKALDGVQIMFFAIVIPLLIAAVTLAALSIYFHMRDLKKVKKAK